MWFKVDDKLWGHRKGLHTSSLALGVWCRVGSYCADQMTDGLVDTRTVYTICPEAPKVVDAAIAELLRVGLWEPLGDDHVQYHDWAEYQPTKGAVEARREADRSRKRGQKRADSGRYAAAGDTGAPPDSARTP